MEIGLRMKTHQRNWEWKNKMLSMFSWSKWEEGKLEYRHDFLLQGRTYFVVLIIYFRSEDSKNVVNERMI